MDILKKIFKNLLKTTNLRLIRSAYDSIDWSQPLIGIMGQRGVGKTTLMLQRIKLTDPEGSFSFYASLDNLWFADNNLFELVERLSEQGVTNFYFDEVHRLPGWERQIKNLYDSYPEFKIVFSGSSLLAIDYSIGDLSRRALLYPLQGLSFREFLLFEGVEPGDVLNLEDILYNHVAKAGEIAQRIDILRYFKKYMAVGYYPFYKTMTTTDYYIRLNRVVTTIIDSDIPAVEKNIEYETLIKAKRLVNIIAGGFPYTPNISSLAGVMGCSRTQLLRLLDLLVRAGIIRSIYAGALSPNSLAKPQKILLNNTSLMQALDSPLIGTERECAFASFLSPRYQLNYSRTGDFMVDRRYIFEVGGKNKKFNQIKDIPDSFLVVDDIAVGYENRIPLWLFGFLA